MRKGITRTHCKDCGIKLDYSNCIPMGMYFGTRCRSCHNFKQKEYNARRTSEDTRKHNLKVKYKMTTEEYDRLVEFQQGGCAICRKPCTLRANLCVDHNHVNNEVRGLLCVNCNSILGLMNDDEDMIWKIAEYLKRTTWKDKVA